MRTVFWTILLGGCMAACSKDTAITGAVGDTNAATETQSDTTEMSDTESDTVPGTLTEYESDTPNATYSEEIKDTGIDTLSSSESASDTSSEIIQDTSAEVYGLIDVALRSDFVLDAERIDDIAYQDEHLAQIATLSPAFTGNVGSLVVPAPEVTDYEILVLHMQTDEGGVLRIVQFAYNGMALVNPVIELSLPTDTYSSGLDIGVCIGQGVIFTVYDLTNSFQKKCVHAISGDATMTVDVAENLTQKDGGRLHLSGEDIPLYYIAKTPHGDLSTAMGMQACEEHN